MDVTSVSALSVASLVWQPRPSTWVLTVICKGTYVLTPGEATFAPEQEPTNLHDEHWDDDTDRSVFTPWDLVPIKPRAEVMLVGQAFAPGGVPARSVVARLSVGEVDKAIEVLCDRTVGPDGQLQEGARFSRMSLRYERAAGGPGTWNPVGLRADARDAYGRRVLPNLRPPFRDSDDPGEPIGFGPLAATWPSRKEKLGRHASTFSPDQLGERPLPEGIDYEYFNQAPRDQHLSQLRDNERLFLENLHVEHPRLLTNLPGVRPAAFVDRGVGPGLRLSLRADTLWIDTDRGIATLTWRGQLALDGKDERGRVLVGIEPAGNEATWEQIENLAGSSSPPSTTGVAVPIPRSRTEAPPPLPPPAKAPPRPMPRNTSEMTVVRPMDAEDRPRQHTVPAGMGGQPVLPFLPGRPAADASGGDRPSLSSSVVGLPFQLAPVTPPGGVPKPPRPPVSMPPTHPQAAPNPGPAGRPPGGMLVPPLPPRPMAPPPVPPPPAAEPVSSPWAGGPAKIPPPEPSSSWRSGPPSSNPGHDGGRPPGPSGLSDAPNGSVAAASNAAAAAAVAFPVSRRPASSIHDLVWEPIAPSSRSALRLVWYDPASVPRLRRVPRWKPILTALEARPLDAEPDEPGPDQDPMAAEDRREVFEILARGEATDGTGIEDALDRAVRDDGKFVPPLVLVTGELDLPFDELETLKAVVSTATPLATPADEGLRAALEVAKDFLKTPDLSASPQVSEALATRVREAFAKEKAALPGDYLDAQAERILLSGRHYQKRELLGESHLRFLLRAAVHDGGSPGKPGPMPPGSDPPLVGYLPAKVAKALPMFRRFRGRLVAEAHLVEEQYESQPSCLRVLALVRVVELPARRSR